jgi:hypothetical protein
MTSPATQRLDLAASSTALVERSSHPDGARPSFERDDDLVSASMVTALTELSETILHVHAIRELCRDNDDLRNRLETIAGRLETITHDLLHGQDDDSRTAARARHPSVAHGISVAHEAAVLSWLEGVTKPDRIQVHGPDAPAIPMMRALTAVTDSRRQLPPSTSARLGVGDAAALGDVASELLHAVEDPTGPRCHSYRSAFFHLCRTAR